MPPSAAKAAVGVSKTGTAAAVARCAGDTVVAEPARLGTPRKVRLWSAKDAKVRATAKVMSLEDRAMAGLAGVSEVAAFSSGT